MSTDAADGFVKVRDIMPALRIEQEFASKFESACKKQLGPVLPEDRPKLLAIAGEVLSAMEAEGK